MYFAPSAGAKDRDTQIREDLESEKLQSFEYTQNSLSILAIGSEILDGRIQDTNSRLLLSELADFGVKAREILSCGDDAEEIAECLKFLSARSNFIVTIGGLGPTKDDCTREALSIFLGVQLERDENLLNDLKNFFKKRGREFNETNAKQAEKPKGAVSLENNYGTAPGILCKKDNLAIVSLPGVPREFAGMLNQHVLRLAKTHLSIIDIYKVGAIFMGVPESEAASIVEGLKLPAEITVSYRAKSPELHLLLKSAKGSDAIRQEAERVFSAIGNEFVITKDLDSSLPKVLGELLASKSLSMGAAESCTGGMLGSLLTDEAGASRYFLGSAVCYSNEAKQQLLSVSTNTIQTFGAVSFECAQEMARGALKIYGSDLSVSITGIAGPDGASEGKPVGTFFIGFASASKCFASRFFYPSDRPAVRRYSAYLALDLLRRELLKLPRSGLESRDL